MVEGSRKTYKEFLMLLMVGANFFSVERLFHNFAPRNENPFWPLAVVRFGISRSVAVLRSSYEEFSIFQTNFLLTMALVLAL